MDFYRNVNFTEQDQVLASPSPCSMLTPLDDLLSAQNTEVDVSMEWLSVFVEDCLSSTGNCLPAAAPISSPNENTPTNPSNPKPPQQNPPNSPKKFPIPGKARSKRKRVTSYKTRNPLSSWSQFPVSEAPLLHHHQAYWLADSELIMPKKETNTIISPRVEEAAEEEEEEETEGGGREGSKVGGRRCSHCLAQKTPQWRAGPLGPKTLCNACGVRYKSGRLLPEYRPAKSPTFVSYLHSNSHKKVLEMRNLSSSSSSPPLFTS